jgi:hypothetical protein
MIIVTITPASTAHTSHQRSSVRGNVAVGVVIVFANASCSRSSGLVQRTHTDVCRLSNRPMDGPVATEPAAAEPRAVRHGGPIG